MGKHKKHKDYRHRSSSSSSSSSSDSNDERKRYKKEQKKIKKLIKKGKLPPNYMMAAGAGAGVGAAAMTGHQSHQTHHTGYPSGQPVAGGYPTGNIAPTSAPGGYPSTAYPTQPSYGIPPGPGYPQVGANTSYGAPSAAPFSAQPVGPGGAAPFNAPPPGPGGAAPFNAPPPGPGGAFNVPPAPAGYGESTGYPQAVQPGSALYPDPYSSGYPASGQGPPGPSTGFVPGYPGGSTASVPPGMPYGTIPGAPGGNMGYPNQPSGYTSSQPAPGGAASYQPPSVQPSYQPPGGAASHQPPSVQPPGGAVSYQPPGGAVSYQPPGGAASHQPPSVQQAATDMGKMKIYGTMERFVGTITRANPFNCETDAETIRKAMKGVGTDEGAIINVITQRSNEQRQQIRQMFKTMYGKDLISDLKSELSGDFKESIMALFMPTTYYDAWTLNQAMMGLGTKESVLIEILCTRTNAEIREIVRAYKEHFHRDLERDIVDDTSGHFKRLLVSCCQGNRAELSESQWQQVYTQGPESIVDLALAQKDAQELYQAGEKKIGTDESTFLKIMAIRHFYQLRATFQEYAKLTQRDILSTISREMSGDLEHGFKALVMSARNRPEYFADNLYQSMKGAGTNDSALIRIVVSRSEIDLVNIKQAFFAKYHKTLHKMVSGDTSGDYKRLLVAIVGRD